MVAKQLLVFSAAQNEGDWTRLGDVIFECVDKSIFSSDTLINVRMYNIYFGIFM